MMSSNKYHTVGLVVVLCLVLGGTYTSSWGEIGLCPNPPCGIDKIHGLNSAEKAGQNRTEDEVSSKTAKSHEPILTQPASKESVPNADHRSIKEKGKTPRDTGKF